MQDVALLLLLLLLLSSYTTLIGVETRPTSSFPGDLPRTRGAPFSTSSLSTRAQVRRRAAPTRGFVKMPEREAPNVRERRPHEGLREDARARGPECAGAPPPRGAS